MHTPKSFGAFTLVEVLIVIGILSILAAVALLTLGHIFPHGTRLKRITDMRTMQSALAQYAADNNGAYPMSTNNGMYWNTQCGIAPGYPGGSLSAENVIPGLAPGYLSAGLSDPNMNTSETSNGIQGTCCYMYKSDGKDYKIIDANCSVAQYTDPLFKSMNMIDPCRPGPNMPSFAIGIWTPGAAKCGATSPANGW